MHISRVTFFSLIVAVAALIGKVNASQNVYELNFYKEKFSCSQRLSTGSHVLAPHLNNWIGCALDGTSHWVNGMGTAALEGLAFLHCIPRGTKDGKQIVLNKKAFVINMFLYAAIDTAKYYALDYVGLSGFMAERFGSFVTKIGSSSGNLQAGFKVFGITIKRVLHGHFTDMIVRECNRFYYHCYPEK